MNRPDIEPVESIIELRPGFRVAIGNSIPESMKAAHPAITSVGIDGNGKIIGYAETVALAKPKN